MITLRVIDVRVNALPSLSFKESMRAWEKAVG